MQQGKEDVERAGKGARSPESHARRYPQWRGADSRTGTQYPEERMIEIGADFPCPFKL